MDRTDGRGISGTKVAQISKEDCVSHCIFDGHCEWFGKYRVFLMATLCVCLSVSVPFSVPSLDPNSGNKEGQAWQARAEEKKGTTVITSTGLTCTPGLGGLGVHINPGGEQGTHRLENSTLLGPLLCQPADYRT